MIRAKKKSKLVIYISIIYIILIMVITIGSVVFFRTRLINYNNTDYLDEETYSKHYVLISGEDTIESLIYDNTLEEGKKYNAYVELFGKNLPESYGKKELLRMAIDSSVDGIILVGDNSEDTANLINEAVEAKIPVITVGEDSSESSRQCFIGVTSYNFGNKYATEILDIIQKSESKLGETIKVGILVDENYMNTSQNVILMAIQSTLAENLNDDYKVEIETIPVDNTSNFSVEEDIRDILLDEREIPDILLCMDIVYSECVYRAIVDYNMVGEINIIGFGNSDSIVNAVTKNIFYSSIYFDTSNMGNMCIQALVEYHKMGYVSGYIPVDTIVIHNDEALSMTEEARYYE